MANDVFWNLIAGALRLDETAYQLMQRVPNGSSLAFFIILLAGLSEASAQAVVLFINRVQLRRFLLSIFIATFLHVFTYGFWTLSVMLVAWVVFGSEVGLGPVARVLALGYAPRLFSFLVFMPYFGIPLYVLITLWNILAVLVGIRVVLGLGDWQALACTLLGGVVLLVLQRTVGRPLMALARWLRRRAAGVELVMDRHGLLSLLDAGPDEGLWPPPVSGQPEISKRNAP